MVACVKVLATPTSYEVRSAAKPLMSLGLTVSALSVASVETAATVPLAGYAPLDSGPSLVLPLSVKLTSILTFFPSSLAVSVYVLEFAPMFASKVVPLAA